MNCGRSSSVEWKLPKLQRRVRFPSPAPAPPGHAPGGFVMPTSHPPSTECGGTIGATLSPRELGPAVPVQNSPCTPGTPPVPVQNSPHTSHTVPLPVQNSPCTSCTVPVPVQNSPCTPKISQFGAFCSCWESFIPFLLPTSRAWRILSRYHQQQDRHATTPGTKLAPHEPHGASPGTKLAPHEPHGTSSGTKLAQQAQNLPIWRVLLLLGEFYPVFVANKPSMASFLPHKHQHHHRHERNNTPTQHTKPRDERLSAHAPHTARRNETFTAPARHKQPKFAHFHHAGANFLSQHTPHTHTRATFLSTNASASKRDPNKTFIIFDSVITSRPDRTDIANGGPVATRRSSALDTAPMHQIAQHCTGN